MGVLGGILRPDGDSEQLVDGLRDRGDESLHVRHIDALLVAAGSEPYVSDDLVVAYDGDLDRSTVSDLADRFRSDGTDAAAAFDGCFRAAIYEREHERVHLVTDKIGSRPLYYQRGGGAFSSHLRALLRLPSVDAVVDRDAVRRMVVAFQSAFTGPQTLIQGVRKVLPAHVTTVTDQHTHRTHYWDFNAQRKRQVTDVTAADQLDRLLHESAERTAEAVDGEVHALLSGGLDSSLLAALLDEHVPGTINTYVWGAEPAHFDRAEQVAEHIGTEHHELDIRTDLASRREVWEWEEPLPVFTTFPIDQLPEAGASNCVSGFLSAATFPAGLERLRSLNRVRWTKPLMRILQSLGADRLLSPSSDIGRGMDMLASPHASTVITNELNLRRRSISRWLSDEGETSVERRIDARWQLRRGRFDEQLAYLKAREMYGPFLGVHANLLPSFDPYGYPPLLKYVFGLPMDQRRGRRLERMIAKDYLPDTVVESRMSGLSFGVGVKREQYRDPEQYRPVMESFLERGVLTGAARPVLLPADIDTVPLLQLKFLDTIYLIERWLQAYVDRDAPWTPPSS